MAYIEFKNVSKIYKSGDIEVKALDNVNFEIEQGELVCILGHSGAGKTTALNILGGMDKATSGKITVARKEITNTPFQNNEIYEKRSQLYRKRKLMSLIIILSFGRIV